MNEIKLKKTIVMVSVLVAAAFTAYNENDSVSIGNDSPAYFLALTLPGNFLIFDICLYLQ